MKFLGIEKEKYAAIFLSYLLSALSIQTSVNLICTKLIGASFTLDTILLEGIFYLLMIITLSVSSFKFNKSAGVLLVILFIGALIAIVKEPETKDYIFGPYDVPFLQKYTPRFFVYCFSGFVAVSYLKDTEYFFDIFERFSYLTVVLGTMYYITSLDVEVEVSYMTFSYNMLLHVTFLMLRCIGQFSLKRLICAVMGIFVIFIAGCRGALVCCFISILIYVLMFKSKNIARKIIVITMSIIISLLMVANFESFLGSIAKILEKNDISSRTVMLISKGEFLEDSGRSELRETIIENFNLFGHGIYADRVLIQSYPHHLLYELMYQYGIVFGIGIFIFICVLILLAFFRSDANNRTLICALLSVGFIKFFFSSSYLSIEPGMYVLLGLCAKIVMEKKIEKQ